MPKDEEFPKLRAVELHPISHDEQISFLLRDPLEFATEPLVVNNIGAFVLSRLDGTHSILDIQADFARVFHGNLVFQNQIDELVTSLRQSYYLEGEDSQRRIASVLEEFSRSDVRRSWHAGQSYDDDPDALKRTIDGFYTDSTGAGGDRAVSSPGKSIRAIMAPHIDLRVGGPCYTHAFQHIHEQSEADLFVILGVAHYGGGTFFAATPKDFETPLGRARTDRELLALWSDYAGQDFVAGEWAHRTEHSIEFPLLFLQHGYPRPHTILPVLLGASEPYLERDTLPTHDPAVKSALSALKKAIKDCRRNPVYILSVDLAHMGVKFGDRDPIDREQARRIEKQDREMLTHIERFDATAFGQDMIASRNSRRVDAISGVLALFELLESGTGQLLEYQQNIQEESGSIVTYASMCFE